MGSSFLNKIFIKIYKNVHDMGTGLIEVQAKGNC